MIFFYSPPAVVTYTELGLRTVGIAGLRQNPRRFKTVIPNRCAAPKPKMGARTIHTKATLLDEVCHICANYLTRFLGVQFRSMNKKLWLCAFLGAIVGATGVQIAHVISDRNSRELFGQRLRCKTLADKYLKEHSATSGAVVLGRVEFSRRRGSCIASTAEPLGLDAYTAAQLGLAQKPSEQMYMFKVVDLLSGEDLVTRTCTGSDDCGKSMQKRDEEFEDAR